MVFQAFIFDIASINFKENLVIPMSFMQYVWLLIKLDYWCLRTLRGYAWNMRTTSMYNTLFRVQ